MHSQRNFAALIAAGLSILFMSIAGVTPAAASYPDRAAALTAYQSIAADQAVDAGWTGSVAGCLAGTESASSLAASLNTVNVLRSLAGLDPVTLNPEMNRNALAAALMVRASGQINHDPGKSWPCYSKGGAEASGESNLYVGLSGADAMVGYVEDPGIADLGHRRWLLDPGATEFGTGSTGTTNALTVVGSHGNGSRMKGMPNDKLVAWPAAGWFPTPLVFKDWSVAIGKGSKVDVSSARVTVTFDGSALPITNLRRLPSGAGVGETLGWQTSLPAAAATGDHLVGVSIAGVKIDGALQGINYTVRTFDPTDASVGAGPPLDLANPVTPLAPYASRTICHSKLKQTAKARKALRKAKRTHRRAAIRKAKRNLKAKKRARRLACR